MNKRKTPDPNSQTNESAKKHKDFSFSDDYIPLLKFDNDGNELSEIEDSYNDEQSSVDLNDSSIEPTCSTSFQNSNPIKNAINKNLNHPQNYHIKKTDYNKSLKKSNVVEITLSDSDQEDSGQDDQNPNDSKKQDNIDCESLSSEDFDLNDLNSIKGFHDFNKSDLVKQNDDSSVSSYCEVLNYESDDGVFDMNHGCIDLNINLNNNFENKSVKQESFDWLNDNQTSTNITNRTIENYKSKKSRDWQISNLEIERLNNKINGKDCEQESESDPEYYQEPEFSEQKKPASIPISIFDIPVPSHSKKSTINRKSTIIDQKKYEHPWTDNKIYSPCILGLHEEIKDFYKYSSLKPEETKVRAFVYSQVKNVILSKWPKDQVHLFGSFETDLSLFTADLDIVVFHLSDKIPFYQLERKLIEHGITTFNETKIISKATVPILKFIHSDTGINVDISFNCVDGKYSKLNSFFIIFRLNFLF